MAKRLAVIGSDVIETLFPLERVCRWRLRSVRAPARLSP